MNTTEFITLFSSLFTSMMWLLLVVFVVTIARRIYSDYQKERARELEYRRMRDIENSQDTRKEDKQLRSTLLRISDNLETMNSYQNSVENSRRQEQVELQRAIQSLSSLREDFSTKIDSITRLSSHSEISNLKQNIFSDKLFKQIANEYEHSIMTPLSSIDVAIDNTTRVLNNFLENIGKTQKDEAVLLDSINIVQSSLKNASTSIKSIQEILESGAGFLPGEAKRFSVQETINKAIRMLTTASKSSIMPTLILMSLPEVKYYPANLLIALIQLLDNAFEAVGAKGEINITGEYKPSTGKVEILITNDGPSISPHIQHKIFEHGCSTKGSGRGLGLSYARKTLEDVKGQVELVTSNNNKTVFKLSFQPEEIYQSNGD